MGFLTTARLVRRAQSDDKAAMQELWCRHVRLCYTVANRVKVRADLVADLILESQEAFPKAIRNFDIDLLLEFSTYTYSAIRSHMLLALPKIRFSTKVPDQLYRPLTRYDSQLVNAPSRDDWFDAREHMIEEGLYERVRDLHVIAHPDPIETATDIACPRQNPARMLTVRSESDLMQQCIQKLDERDQFIIVSRYGLWDRPEMTLQQVGDILQVTRERVRQLQLIAEQRLRELLTETGTPKPQQPG